MLGRCISYLTVATLCTLLVTRAEAAGLMSLREAALSYRNYSVVSPEGRDPLIYPEKPKESLNLSLKIDLFRYLFWDSVIHSTTTSAQYRGVGLETNLGLNVHHNLSVGFYHHSEHVLDRPHAFMEKFPVVDALEVRVFLYRAKDGREAVF